MEEAEERSVSDDAEAAGENGENGEGEASEDPGASLLSRPVRKGRR